MFFFLLGNLKLGGRTDVELRSGVGGTSETVLFPKLGSYTKCLLISWCCLRLTMGLGGDDGGRLAKASGNKLKRVTKTTKEVAVAMKVMETMLSLAIDKLLILLNNSCYYKYILCGVENLPLPCGNFDKSCILIMRGETQSLYLSVLGVFPN